MFVFPALALARQPKIKVPTETDLFDAKFQQYPNMIDREDFFDAIFDTIAETTALDRSSRDLIGWNRNVNHGFEREQRMKSNRSASRQFDFILSTEQYSVQDILQAMTKIKERQDRIRRMKMVQKMVY